MSADAPEPDYAQTTPPAQGEATPAAKSNQRTPPNSIPSLAPLDPLTRPEELSRGPAALPRDFGRYALLEELAHGGMGIVYRARDPLFDQTVALKMIRGGFQPTPDDLIRFGQEARVGSRVKHPHIIPVYEIGCFEGQHYFTMKLVEGGSLNQHRQRFFADPRAATGLVAKVARAVHCAHQGGILHRDLKPANVLLDQDDEPLVADFGLAKVLDASTDLTHTGQVLGTPGYMAPEQAAGQPGAISVRTDVWSLGVILYELLCGQRPFPGRGRDEVIGQILSSDPPTLRTLRPELDPGLEAVVLKCLEKDPAQRYDSAGALADDLESWTAGRQPRVRPPGVFARLATRARRHSLVLLGSSLVLALTAVLAIVLGGPDPAEAERVRREAARRKEFLEPLQRQLAEGQSVVLIGASGGPAWSVWSLVEEEAMQAVAQRDNLFEIDAWKGISLLELLADPQQERYRFRAEVQHSIAPRTGGEVGIYVGDSAHPTRAGVVHCFAALAFNDGADLGERPRNDVRLRMHMSWREPSGRVPYHHMDLGVAMPFEPGGIRDRARPWRPVSIEVTPDEIRAFWGEQLIGAAERNSGKKRLQLAIDQLPSRMAPEPEKVRPEIRPRGALGLYVRHAGARFRNVVVEPLK